jgi:steroid delta-isomerase-like uncharacterized protein
VGVLALAQAGEARIQSGQATSKVIGNEVKDRRRIEFLRNMSEEQFMPVKENVTLMRRWFKEVWNEGKMQTVNELLAPDAVGVGEVEDGVPVRGPAEFIPFVERIRGAFPDINISVDDIFGSKDKVVVRWSASMTHKGDYLGMLATHKPVRLTGITITRIANGQIVEGWDNWDQLAMLKQIGAYERPRDTLPKSA